MVKHRDLLISITPRLLLREERRSKLRSWRSRQQRRKNKQNFNSRKVWKELRAKIKRMMTQLQMDISKRSCLRKSRQGITWRNLKMYVLTPRQRKNLRISIGTSVIHVAQQEVMDVAQFVQGNAIKDIMQSIKRRVISFATVETQGTARVQLILVPKSRKVDKTRREVGENNHLWTRVSTSSNLFLLSLSLIHLDSLVASLLQILNLLVAIHLLRGFRNSSQKEVMKMKRKNLLSFNTSAWLTSKRISSN